ncbi:MAG: methyl-accepting chemotaxis protein [Spirochaetales bacterium]|nr:methyl-accepting chemotaxis protein [Spirochaetales bacterium]
MRPGEFFKKFLNTEIAGIGVGLPVAAAYAVILTDMPSEKIASVLIMAAVLGIVIVLFVGMPLNFIISKKVRKLLKKDIPTREEQNQLFHALHRLPIVHAIAIFARVAAGAVAAGFYMVFIIGIETFQAVMAVLLALYGSYIAGLLAYTLAFRLVRPLLEDLEYEIKFTEEELSGKNHFGISFFRNNLYFIFIPIVFTTVTVYLSIEASFYSGLSVFSTRLKIIIVILINLATNLSLGLLVVRSYKSTLLRISENLKVIATNSGNLRVMTKTTIKDEMEHLIYLLNVSFQNLGIIIEKIQKNNSNISTASLNLSAMSEEIATTSNGQAAAVNEIVTTMEESSRLSEEVALNVREIDGRASEIEMCVDQGVKLIEENRQQMEMITDADKETVIVIETLNDSINSIWEIVNIINSIASQTKIIAFNAELEATAAGEAGRNFQIVATEIRRLADNTVSSTGKIKDSMSDIQSFSESLSKTSSIGTARINEGIETTGKLKNLMARLREMAGATNDFAGSISKKTEQQAAAFQQILLTLKQISSGIGQFAASTTHISENTHDMKKLVNELEELINTFSIN